MVCAVYAVRCVHRAVSGAAKVEMNVLLSIISARSDESGAGICALAGALCERASQVYGRCARTLQCLCASLLDSCVQHSTVVVLRLSGFYDWSGRAAELEQFHSAYLLLCTIDPFSATRPAGRPAPFCDVEASKTQHNKNTAKC